MDRVRDELLTPLEREYVEPDIFRRHPIPDYLDAEQFVQAVWFLWGRWSPTSQAAQELRFLFAHYNGDLDGSLKALSNSRL